MVINNCHVHIFTGRAVPAEFLPLGLVRVLSRRRCSRLLGRFLNWLNPFSRRDLFDRYGAFVEIGGSAVDIKVGPTFLSARWQAGMPAPPRA